MIKKSDKPEKPEKPKIPRRYWVECGEYFHGFLSIKERNLFVREILAQQAGKLQNLDNPMPIVHPKGHKQNERAEWMAIADDGRKILSVWIGNKKDEQPGRRTDSQIDR